MIIFLNWLAAGLWAYLIFYLSSKPGLAVASGFWDFATRKPAHVLIFLVLFLLLVKALAFSFKKLNFPQVLFWAVVVAFLYAVSDEVHQIFVPLRTGRVLDIILDTTGVVIVAILLWKYDQNLPTKLKKLLHA